MFPRACGGHCGSCRLLGRSSSTVLLIKSETRMSDRIDWKPVVAWASVVAVQAGSAMYERWQRFQYRLPVQQPTQGWERVLAGQTVNGWKMAAFTQSDEFNRFIGDPDYAVIVPPACPIDQSVRNASSLLMMIEVPNPLNWTPNGIQSIFTLSRHSLVDNRIMCPVMRVIYRNVHEFEFSCHVTERIVASVFRERAVEEEIEEEKVFHLILADVVQKSFRLIKINAPPTDRPVSQHHRIQMQAVCDGDTTKRRLNIVFVGTGQWIEDDTHRFEVAYYLASYEIPADRDTTAVIKPLAWQSISIVRSSEMNVARSHPHLVFVAEGSDQLNGWVFSPGKDSIQVASVREWMHDLESTPDGPKVIAAMNDYRALSLVLIDCTEIIGRQIGGFVFGNCSFGNVFSRRIEPASLKWLAIQAFLHANPRFDVRKLKCIIGFDVFDGMLDEDVNEFPVIQLRCLSGSV